MKRKYTSKTRAGKTLSVRNCKTIRAGKYREAEKPISIPYICCSFVFMKKIAIASSLLSLLVAGSSCTKTTRLISGKHPACLDTELRNFLKSGGSCPSGNTVKVYEFQQKKVYVIAPGNCGADMTSRVLDDKCVELGSLGGFTGNTKINNEDFATAVYKETVYKD